MGKDEIIIADHGELDPFEHTGMLGVTVLGFQYIKDHASIKTSEENWDWGDFIKNNRSSLIFHLDPERYFEGQENEIHEPVLIAGHLGGHSEGGFPFIQNIVNRTGPWILDEEQSTVYLQHNAFPHLSEPKFMADAPNPLKIKRVFYGIFPPDSIIKDFQRRGYTFVNKPMSEERWDIVELRGYARQR